MSDIFIASSSFSKLGAVSGRKAYRTLIKNLSAITEVASSKKLTRFLELWEEELNNKAANSEE